VLAGCLPGKSTSSPLCCCAHKKPKSNAHRLTEKRTRAPSLHPSTASNYSLSRTALIYRKRELHSEDACTQTRLKIKSNTSADVHRHRKKRNYYSKREVSCNFHLELSFLLSPKQKQKKEKLRNTSKRTCRGDECTATTTTPIAMHLCLLSAFRSSDKHTEGKAERKKDR